MVIGFWKRNDEYGCCSNWYPASITINGITFSCCEQYMMYQKAILFDDHEIADKIINTTIPKDIKALGRQVKNFDPAIWDKHKEMVVGTAVMAKFIQHPDLYKKLQESGDAIMCEAAPNDNIWGIGMAADNPKMQNPEEWQGTNLLGKIVMNVRTLIAQGKTQYESIL